MSTVSQVTSLTSQEALVSTAIYAARNAFHTAASDTDRRSLKETLTQLTLKQNQLWKAIKDEQNAECVALFKKLGDDICATRAQLSRKLPAEERKTLMKFMGDCHASRHTLWEDNERLLTRNGLYFF